VLTATDRGYKILTVRCAPTTGTRHPDGTGTYTCYVTADYPVSPVTHNWSIYLNSDGSIRVYAVR
jgi:hypothetical protein